MARWTKAFLAEASERITQMGLTACPVCGSQEIGVHKYPALLEWGASGHRVREQGAEGNLDLLVRTECGSCGNSQLFNSERFRRGDEPILVEGITEEEEDRLSGR